MRRSLLLALLLLNLLLAPALVTAPAGTQVVPRGLWDCCMHDNSLDAGGYCCERCCWFTWDCRTDADCSDPESK